MISGPPLSRPSCLRSDASDLEKPERLLYTFMKGYQRTSRSAPPPGIEADRVPCVCGNPKTIDHRARWWPKNRCRSTTIPRRNHPHTYTPVYNRYQVYHPPFWLIVPRSPHLFRCSMIDGILLHLGISDKQVSRGLKDLTKRLASNCTVFLLFLILLFAYLELR